MKKKRMSQKKFVSIWTPILAVLLVVTLAATIVMNMFSLTIDMYLGKGKRHEVTANTSGWDVNYYTNLYASEANPSDAALRAATEKARQAANEGFVLLKNGDRNGAPLLPLAENTPVTPFGYRFIQPAWCPMGSGSTNNGYMDYGDSNAYSEDMSSALAKNFKLNESVVAAMQAAQPERVGEAPGTTPCQYLDSPIACGGCNTFLTEYAPSVYAGLESSCADTVGIVFIGRETGEGGDLKWDAYADGTPHMLTLSQNEKAAITYAKDNCTKGVVAIINSASVMELGLLMSGEYEVDAILWIGLPGSIGAMSMSDILCGKVNPSGRTSDIYMANIFNDPTFANTGLFTYLDPDFTGDQEQSFIEYEEGVYHGYKYYETADVMDPGFDYEAAVVFPFGYGLSYTTFEQEIVSTSEDADTVSVTVRVRNTGAVDGKEVVQLYYTAPYTAEFDGRYNIEKPVKVLLAFDKVEVKSGGTAEVTLTFLKEEMASYCYTVENSDGTRGAYVLEQGSYVLSLGKNSHDVWDTAQVNIPDTIWYAGNNPRQSEKNGQSILDEDGIPTGVPSKRLSDPEAQFVAASNLFEDCNTYMSDPKVTLLSRKDWTGTFPTRPTDQTRTMSAEVKKAINDFGQFTFDQNTNTLLGNVPGSLVYTEDMPLSRQMNGLTLLNMRGLDYNDPLWEDLLDQIDFSSDQLWQLIYTGTYNISELDAIGMPASVNGESPSGIGLMTKLINAADREAGTCSYPCGVVLASTWNTQLIYELGLALGDECMNFAIRNGTFSGMTAPSVNLHRSPFNGRNCEYYSEDPVLAGNIAAAQISGMGDKGLYVIFKHFAMNNQETGKTYNSGMCTWATEQTMREEYLKAFELIFKNSRRTVKYIADAEGNTVSVKMRGATGVMTSFNRVGAVPTGGNYALITGLLRNEWGFNGIVQTDMPCQTNRDLLLRAGGTIEMSYDSAKPIDTGSATARTGFRRAVHDIAYTAVNSIAVNGIAPGTTFYYDISPWKIALIAVDVVIGLFIAAMAVFMILRGKDAKKDPDRYESNKRSAVQ